MLYTTVIFRDSNFDKQTGIVVDKIKVLPVGANANFTQYVIVNNETQKVFIVNPINVIESVLGEEKEQSELNYTIPKRRSLLKRIWQGIKRKF